MLMLLVIPETDPTEIWAGPRLLECKLDILYLRPFSTMTVMTVQVLQYTETWRLVPLPYCTIVDLVHLYHNGRPSVYPFGTSRAATVKFIRVTWWHTSICSTLRYCTVQYVQ